MAYFQDSSMGWWLSGFRPIALVLLLIGECMAQSPDIHLDLVGLQRRKVQVIMKDHSFSEYQKDHVTYVLGGGNFQRVNYLADTCSSIQIITSKGDQQFFQERIDSLAKELSVGYMVEEVNDGLTYFVESRVRPKRTITEKKARTRSRKKDSKPNAIVADSEERKAADARYFTVQKRSYEKDSGHVRVLGWKK